MKIPAKFLDMNQVMPGSRVYQIFKDEVSKLSANDKAALMADFATGNDGQLQNVFDNVGIRVMAETKTNIKEQPVYEYLFWVLGLMIAGLFVAGYITGKNK